MQMTACVLVGVRAVRLLVELLTVLEDVGAVFGGLSTGDIAVERGETGVYRSVPNRTGTNKEHMGMKRLAFIALFIAETPVDYRWDIKNCGLNTGMVKAMF